MGDSSVEIESVCVWVAYLSLYAYCFSCLVTVIIIPPSSLRVQRSVLAADKGGKSWINLLTFADVLVRGKAKNKMEKGLIRDYYDPILIRKCWFIFYDFLTSSCVLWFSFLPFYSITKFRLKKSKIQQQFQQKYIQVRFLMGEDRVVYYPIHIEVSCFFLFQY